MERVTYEALASSPFTQVVHDKSKGPNHILVKLRDTWYQVLSHDDPSGMKIDMTPSPSPTQPMSHGMDIKHILENCMPGYVDDKIPPGYNPYSPSLPNVSNPFWNRPIFDHRDAQSHLGSSAATGYGQDTRATPVPPLAGSGRTWPLRQATSPTQIDASQQDVAPNRMKRALNRDDEPNFTQPMTAIEAIDKTMEQVIGDYRMAGDNSDGYSLRSVGYDCPAGPPPPTPIWPPGVHSLGRQASNGTKRTRDGDEASAHHDSATGYDSDFQRLWDAATAANPVPGTMGSAGERHRDSHNDPSFKQATQAATGDTKRPRV